MRTAGPFIRRTFALAVPLAFCLASVGCDDSGSQPAMTQPTEEQKAKSEAANKATMEGAKEAAKANKKH